MDIQFYSRSRYLRPKLSLRQYQPLFATAVVGSGVLKALGGTHIFYLALAFLAIIISSIIIWKL